jgi:hypothetical protein
MGFSQRSDDGREPAKSNLPSRQKNSQSSPSSIAARNKSNRPLPQGLIVTTGSLLWLAQVKVQHIKEQRMMQFLGSRNGNMEIKQLGGGFIRDGGGSMMLWWRL